MKRLLLLCFALLTLQTSFAQGQFAPVGAEWWYHGNDGHYLIVGGWHRVWVDHVEVVGDILIDGIEARKINIMRTAKLKWEPTVAIPADSAQLFVYDTPDTVFIYDTNRTSFIPLYVYNVSEGDTVTLPVPFYQSGGISDYDSFSFVVDSIRMENFDTTALRSFYIHTVTKENDTQSFTWGGWSWHDHDLSPARKGRYTERLGGVWNQYSSLLPIREIYLMDYHLGLNLPTGELACYADPNYSIHLAVLPCDSLIDYPLSIVDDKAKLTGISIYPNPATDIINIAALNNLPANTTATLFDISGRMLLSSQLSGNATTEINIAHLPKGLYWMHISANGQAPVYRKIVLR